MRARSTMLTSAALTLTGALLLTGCGDQELDARTVTHSAPAGPSAAPTAPAGEPATGPVPAAVSAAPTPTLRP
jgi:hypothetical protein